MRMYNYKGVVIVPNVTGINARATGFKTNGFFVKFDGYKVKVKTLADAKRVIDMEHRIYGKG